MISHGNFDRVWEQLRHSIFRFMLTCAANWPEIWQGCRSGEWTHPRASSRQSLGAGVEQRYELMDSPKPAQSYDLTKILVERKTDAHGMVKYGEKFFFFDRIRPAAGNFLATLSVHQAAGP